MIDIPLMNCATTIHNSIFIFQKQLKVYLKIE